MKVLSLACVAIPGLGGVGGFYAEILARQGVGRFKIADFDRFEVSNFNRQLGATLASVGRPKLEVFVERIRAINPGAEVTAFEDGVTPENIDAFLEGVDVVMDSIDAFSIGMRRLIYRKAYEKNIPVVAAGPLGFGAALQAVMPGGMTFDEFYDMAPGLSEEEQLLRFVVGLAPKALHRSYFDPRFVNISEKTGPSSSIGVSLCGALASMEAVKILLGWKPVRGLPDYAQFDARKGRWITGRLRRGNRSWLQRIRLVFARRYFRHTLSAGRDARAEQDGPVHRILRAALLSPSGENCQPWRIGWNGKTLRIRLRPERARHTLDRRFHASYLSLGCLIESISIAAMTEHLRPNIRFESDPETRFHTAHITFGPSSDAPDELAGMLERRHTDRRPFEGGRLSQAFLKKLETDARHKAPASLYIADRLAPETQRYIELAETTVWTHERAHRDLFRWLRFSDAEKRRLRDGLPWNNLGVSALDAIGLWFCRRFSVQSALNPALVLPTLRKRIRSWISSSAAFGLVTVTSDDPIELVNAGRLFFRAWCRLNSAGFGFHPLTCSAISVYDAATDALNESPLHPEYRRAFETGGKRLKASFGFSENEIPVALFRTGRSSPLPPKRRTLRLRLDDVVDFGEGEGS